MARRPPSNGRNGPLPSSAREGMSKMPRAFSLDGREPFVIAGNDLSGDIIAHALATAGLPASRAHVGSYTALVNLYAKQANAALVSKGCPTWRSASSVWRRSCPCGSAFARLCRLLFGNTCIIARSSVRGCATGRPPQPSSRFASFRPKGKIGGALLIDRRFLWQILRIKYFPISERMTILHNETRRRSRERTKPSSA